MSPRAGRSAAGVALALGVAAAVDGLLVENVATGLVSVVVLAIVAVGWWRWARAAPVDG